MKITRLQPPTIEEVQRTISALEKEFRVSSGKFASNERAYRSVPEDIAANWDLALHQLDVLRPVKDEKRLPSLHDLRGVAPKATGAVSAEDFVRSIRDANW